MNFRRIQLAREAGDITRFHTARMIHDETVGHHTFNLINLLLILTEGAASRELILAALCHDLGEIATGDIPANVKSKMTPRILDSLYSMEEQVVSDIHPCLSYELTAMEDKLLNLADKLDGLLKCVDEINLGNRHIIKIGSRYCNYLNKMLQDPIYTNYRETVEDTIHYFEELCDGR